MNARRLILGCVILMALTSCVDTRNYKPQRPYMSLKEILATLSHIGTEDELVAAFGPPDASRRYLEPGDTRESWKQYFSSTPSSLLDTLSPESKLVTYQIVLYDAINPWVSDLYVGIDSEGRVVGWMHQGSGFENQMNFYHGR